jgi:uncharacterized RDD family membrane protein YckC
MEWQPPVPPGPSPPTPPPPTSAPPPQPPAGYGTSTGAPQGTWAGKPLASWWSRVGATIIDALIVGIPIAAIALAVDPALGLLLGFTAALTYYPLLMIRGGDANGQTLGKQAVGIRVVLNSAEPFTYGPAVLREFVIKYLLFGVVGGFFLAIPTLLDDLWPLWDDQNRALHDMLASTHVVQA